MSEIDNAIRVLRVTEGNILSQWACAGREVFKPYKVWLSEVRRAADLLEKSNDRIETACLIRTCASLNPDAREIGAGMLAQIVSEARRIQAAASHSDLTAAVGSVK